MYTNQLSTFVQVAKFKSFTKIAEKHGVTPASIMKQINSLEDRLSLVLFERTNRGVELTEQGKIIYTSALKIIKEADEALSKAKGERHALRIGTSLLNPCKPLIDICNRNSDIGRSFSLQIIPFEDDRRKIITLISELGKTIDIIVGACGSDEWKSKSSFLQLGTFSVEVAVPYTHHLAGSKLLTVSDLYGESIMIGSEGDAPDVDIIRHDLLQNHPDIKVIDTERFYDADVFNQTVERGCLLLTLEPWHDIHPSLVSIPVDWNYQMPYGIIYAKNPSSTVQKFISAIEKCEIFVQKS